MRLPTPPKLPGSQGFPTWPPLLATRGPGSRSELHAHHAMHLVLPVSGELRVKSTSRALWLSCAGVLTMPDVAHAIDAQGLEVLFVFLEPESAVGASLARATRGPLRAISSKERQALLPDSDPRAIMGELGIEWTRRVVSVLGAEQSPAPARPMHPRVRRLLRLLQSDAAADDTSLETLARAVGLSPGRMMHVFTDSVGVPLRPYLAWLKLQRAAGAIATGLPLAEAAHAAGFSDAGHMSRTFRRMFGVPPSRLRPTAAAS